MGSEHTYYVLNAAGEPVPEPDAQAWGRWFETFDSRLAVDLITCPDWQARVSSVFLGLDHSFGFGPPLLWETMVFGGPLDGEQRRYSTQAEALAGHAALVQEVKRRA